jgi:imidazole glycerol phosphate synthase subunit HisF
MTPKEKAQKLVYIYSLKSYGVIHESFAKQCALIAVDEILELKETQEEYQIQYDNGEWSRELGYRYSKYWQEVKQEIEAL